MPLGKGVVGALHDVYIYIKMKASLPLFAWSFSGKKISRMIEIAGKFETSRIIDHGAGLFCMRKMWRQGRVQLQRGLFWLWCWFECDDHYDKVYLARLITDD